MKPEVTKEVLSALIQHLRHMEMKDGDKPMEVGAMVEDENAPGEEESDMLEEPDLELGEMEDDSQQLTPAQEKIRDFFNNKRPKGNSNDKKSRTFMMDSRGAEAPKGKGKFR